MRRDKQFPTQWHAQQAEKSAVKALKLLCQARDEMANACAPKTLARIRLAISSAKGAVRNAGYRVTHAYYTERRVGEPAPDFEDIATSWPGEKWRPYFIVSHEDADDGYYWKDLESDDGWAGPFETEAQAWQAICETYGLK